MTELERYKAAVDTLEDHLVFKADYSAEKERLRGIHNNLGVMRYLRQAPIQRINEVYFQCERLMDWMAEQEKNAKVEKACMLAARFDETGKCEDRKALEAFCRSNDMLLREKDGMLYIDNIPILYAPLW